MKEICRKMKEHALYMGYGTWKNCGSSNGGGEGEGVEVFNFWVKGYPREKT